MANKPNNNFDDDDFDEDNLNGFDDEFLECSNNLFPPEWYDKVTEAINFTLSILDKNNLKDRDKIAKTIIDYNIEKRLNENLISLPLPKVYNWSKSDAIEIFEDFAYLLNLIKTKPDFKEHKLVINFGKNTKGKDYFNFWKNMSLDELRSLKLITKDISKTKVECTIKRIKKGK